MKLDILLLVFYTLISCSTTLHWARRFKQRQTQPNITAGLKCSNVAGIAFCNGTNDFYNNSTLTLGNVAKDLQNKMLRRSNMDRNGLEFCPHEPEMGSCTILESIVIPTYITNSMGQPRFIYQNKHLGIVQKIKLSVCKSKMCGGYNKCQETLRPLGLIAINPHRPHELIVDTFIIPGCCPCEIPWLTPGGPEVLVPPPDFGHHGHHQVGIGSKPRPPPPNFEFPDEPFPHFVKEFKKDSRMD